MLNEIAEQLKCPSEPVRFSIETVNGVITRDTRFHCVELINYQGDRVVIKAFGVENISEVNNIVDLSNAKFKFTQEVIIQLPMRLWTIWLSADQSLVRAG